MLSIDEAIEKNRKIAETKKTLYDACILEEYNRHLLREYKEHEQLAEWLEELKELRATSCGYSKEDIELNRNAMYNKAIDDFINACKSNTLCQTFGLRQCDIEEIAEQLKAGGKNENYNKEES